MDAHQAKFHASNPRVLSLAFLQDVIAYARVSPAALGFWFWLTNSAFEDLVQEAARARFGLERDQVAVLVAELSEAGLLDRDHVAALVADLSSSTEGTRS